MTTLGLNFNGAEWKNIVSELSLSQHKKYLFQNVSASTLILIELETEPTGDEPRHFISPNDSFIIIPKPLFGIWIKAKSDNTNIAKGSVTEYIGQAANSPIGYSGAIKVSDIDENYRSSLNTVFGEKMIGTRTADIAAQFQYGFPQSAASPEVSDGGSISTSESMLIVSTGADPAGYAAIANRKALRYLPGHEAYSTFTAVFTTPKENSYQRAGLFDSQNGFFIGYEGLDFKATRRRDGVDYSQTIDLSSIFDYADGVLNPMYGNVYRISFGYLGFAPINFEVLSPKGEWIFLSKIEYPNSSTDVHILNTNLQPRAEVKNNGNNTNIQIKVGSFCAGIVNGGSKDPAARRFTHSASALSITAGTYIPITFRNKTTFNSLNNYISNLFTLLSFNTDLSKSSLWSLELNPTITNTPTWIDINTSDSIIEYSTNVVATLNSGTKLFPIPLGKIDRELITDLESQEIELLPGDYITLFILTPGGTIGTIDYSFRWKELF